MASTVFPAASAGVTPKTIAYTSGTTVFTAPAGTTTIELILVGGGGAGGDGSHNGSTFSSAGGGGGGQYFKGNIVVVPGTSYNVVIGAGGARVANTIGANGTSSTFGSLATALGGGGGGVYDAVTLDTGACGGGSGMTGGYDNRFGGAGGGMGSKPYSYFSDGVEKVGGIDRGPTGVGGSTKVGIGLIGSHGAFGGNAAGDLVNATRPHGGMGINGFCGGGGGGVGRGITDSWHRSFGSAGGGTGALGTTSVATSAAANTGSGGGGGAGDATRKVAGAGGSGYAKITYWS